MAKYRLGIDAGGTFTDFVLASEGGDILFFKELSTPSDPMFAIVNGLAQIAAAAGESVETMASNADMCVNGTTVALNALIQRKGAKTGLVCTLGHENSLEIRLAEKRDRCGCDANYPPATMLVPRHLRRGVRERMISTGDVRVPMEEEDVRAACELFLKEGVRSVAISFVWSAINPVHERRAAAIVREMMPDAFLTVGSELYPQVRESALASTAVVNSYLGPIMREYVDSVDAHFRELGTGKPVWFFQSDGGLATGEELAGRSVYAINSGLASVPQAGLRVAEPFGEENIITVDMGGTSFDITLTRNGATRVDKKMDFLRYRAGVPMIRTETLGAGGGSIGHVDERGLMRVGPESAGADPGPACYGRGGKRPTVSDANLVLGYLDPDGLVAGQLPLDLRKARLAIGTHLAEPLGLGVERAAFDMHAIVNSNMADGIRRVFQERGEDLRDFALVGAGGAIGAHIAALAQELGIGKALIPKLASGLCAYGQIISDVKRNCMAPFPAGFDDAGVADGLARTYAEIEERGIAELEGGGFPRDRIDIARSLDMRYVGQVRECAVDIGDMEISEAGLAKIAEAFHGRHEELYAYSELGAPVEVVNVESAICGRIDKLVPMKLGPSDGGPAAALKRRRGLILSADCEPRDSPVYDGNRLGAGDRIEGPAVVEEDTTTILVPAGWIAELHETGVYALAAS